MVCNTPLVKTKKEGEMPYALSAFPYSHLEYMYINKAQHTCSVYLAWIEQNSCEVAWISS